MNRVLDFNICWMFRPIWTCFANIIRKTENQSPSPVFLIKFILSSRDQQSFPASPKRFPQKPWNFCEMIFIDNRAKTEIWTQQWQGKGKWMETMLLRYQSLVTSNSRTALKSTFHSIEIANEWKWRQGAVVHTVRFISKLSYELHIQILKYFHSEFMCSVASNYHENNKVKDFLANFWSGCLSDFTKLPRV